MNSFSADRVRSGALEPVFAGEGVQINPVGMAGNGMPHQGNGFAGMQGESYEMNWDDPIWWLHCDCHGMPFRKRADLARHLNKESQRFKCEVPDCPSTPPDGKAPCFGTLNDKKRHYRDVHSVTLDGQSLARFYCPWVHCRRHNEGFPRKQNLENHIKSLHGGQEPDSPTAEDTAALPDAVGNSARPSSMQPFVATTPGSDLYSSPASQAALGSSSPAMLKAEDPSLSDLQMPPVPPLTTAPSIESMGPLTADEESDPVLRNLREESTNAQKTCAIFKEKLKSLQEAMIDSQRDLEVIERKEMDLKAQLDARRKELRRRKRVKRSIGTRRGH